ncbi:POT family-domain-containing protein [Mucidula mucida]|nr:POT family-domain-containing protein [Mucidula mucida]
MATAAYETEKNPKGDDVSVLGSEKQGHEGSFDDDSIVEGSEGVTQREFTTLRLVPDKINFSSWLVIIVEFAERWSYYGTINVLNNYVRAPLPQGSRDGSVPPGPKHGNGIAGALNKGQQKSFTVRTFNSFWFYVTPWIGGIIADCYLGRYNTIMLFSIVCLAGHIILVGSATPPSIANPDQAYGLLFLAVIVMGIGGGAIKANVSPMIAEQYTGKLRKVTLPSGEDVLISPAVTIQRIYNWFYAAINWGSAGAISASFLPGITDTGPHSSSPLVYSSWFPLFSLWVGRVHCHSASGSILLETLRVITMCIGDKLSWNPRQTVKQFRAPGFWDVARPSSYRDGELPSRITWDDQFVGEVVRTLKACQVFTALPFFYLCYSQIDGNLGTVAAGMKLDLIIFLRNLNPIVIIIIIPIMDLLVYPALRRNGFNFTPIKRITLGFFIAGLAMLYAAILQKFVYEQSPCHDNLPSECVDENGDPNPAPINVWIVAGPYILVGMAEIFTSLVANEYAFTKSPKRMKSTVMAFSLFMQAISAALNLALTAVNTEDKFTWLFGSFAIVAWIVGLVFFFYFRDLDKQEAALNVIGTGSRKGFANETADVTTAVHHHGEEKLGKAAGPIV